MHGTQGIRNCVSDTKNVQFSYPRYFTALFLHDEFVDHPLQTHADQNGLQAIHTIIRTQWFLRTTAVPVGTAESAY